MRTLSVLSIGAALLGGTFATIPEAQADADRTRPVIYAPGLAVPGGDHPAMRSILPIQDRRDGHRHQRDRYRPERYRPDGGRHERSSRGDAYRDARRIEARQQEIAREQARLAEKQRRLELEQRRALDRARWRNDNRFNQPYSVPSYWRDGRSYNR